jgi:predicted DNA-binding antitoxin AbrB/MazE fold protein
LRIGYYRIREVRMQTINAIFDGNIFKPIEPIPVKGKYEVIITFTKSIDANDKKCQRILKYFGTWDDEDVKTINEIVEERANFSVNRDAI